MVTGNSNTIVIPKSYRGLQVLLLGNYTTSLKYVKSTLEQYSYKVTWEESPDVALSLVGEDEEESKYYDLVITDMDMMELDDFRFFNHIILNTELPIILMCGDENNDVLRKALNQAACFLLRKPISPQALANVWQHVFRVRRIGQGKQILQENDFWEGNDIEINGEIPQVQSIVHATDVQNSVVHAIDVQNISNVNSRRSVMNQEKEDCLMKTDEEDDDKNDMEDERLNKKPRMSWTHELRLKFEKAIIILGGEEKARPKEILKLMCASNLTLRHVSSHLQKYREKMKRAGINCASAQPHPSKLTNMDSGMKRKYQNGKPWDLHDMNSKKSPVAGTVIQPMRQHVTQQYNTESSSVYYQIDMIKKLLDKANGKKTNDIKGYMKVGCYKELTKERSSMHASDPNEGETNTFRLREISENISAMILNPDCAAASDPYLPYIYEDYLAPNECSDLLNHLNMDMGFILSERNSSGLLEDIIFSSHGLGN